MSDLLPYLGDRYTVLEQIGAGGMGRVYLAHDARHDRRVAVKVLEPGSTRGVGTERFLQEIRIAASLQHPNIVPLYDSGESGGHLFYVMPYVEGETLRQRLEREAMLPVNQVLAWAADVADGLAAAHACGVVHRDIKPENLLLQDDHLLIADFGVGRMIGLAVDDGLTSEQVAVGTPVYMSPEQAGAGKVDGRSDIYSLACVVYEMLAGEPPFRGVNAQSINAKKLSSTYPDVRVIRPSVPKGLAEALERALAPIPADRFASVEEFAAALRRPARRRIPVERQWVAGLGLAVVAGVIGLAVAGSGGPPAVARQRVVVNPFENRTGSEAYDAIGLMAADWVTEGLQRTNAVDVVPTLSAAAAASYVREFPDTTDPIRALAKETGARLVVTGTVYRDSDSLIVHAQLSDPAAGRLIGAIEPLRVDGPAFAEALQQLRARVMGLLALSLDERVIQTDRPPTYEAYQAFSDGVSAYVRNEYAPALGAFLRAYASDTTFVLPLLYAAFCHVNRREYAAADSALAVVSRQRERLNDYDKDWLDYQVAELAGDEMGALSAIRRAALRAPGSKAAYNFAATAFEAGQPVQAESTLRRLSPDLGPMRGWLPYWEILTSALHVQGKQRQELAAAMEARKRFPTRLEADVLVARALAAQGRLSELDALALTARTHAGGDERRMADFALEVGDELQAHSQPGASAGWYRRAYGQYVALDSTTSGRGRRWGIGRVAARLGRWEETLALGEGALARDADVADLGLTGVAAARLEQRTLAENLLRRLADDQRPYTLGHAQFEAARIAAALGQRSRADNLLVSAYTRGYPYDIDFHRDPLLNGIRGR